MEHRNYAGRKATADITNPLSGEVIVEYGDTITVDQSAALNEHMEHARDWEQRHGLDQTPDDAFWNVTVEQ